MKTYAGLITMYALIVTGMLATMVTHHKAGPKSGLPEDRYHFYSTRVQELRLEAERCQAQGDGEGRDFNLKSAKLAQLLAVHYRDEFNKQLQIRLYRALAIAGDPKMFKDAYDVQKLR